MSDLNLARGEGSDVEEFDEVEELEASPEYASEGGEEALPAEDELPSDKVADLVELLVCGLVDDVDAVSLDVTDSDEGSLIEINVSADDVGKVIGRRGRTIKSIRTLARALGQRLDTEVEVEVLG